MSQNDMVLALGGTVCFVLIVYAALQLRPRKKNNIQNGHRKNGNHHLAEISRLWTENDNRVIDFRKIAKIWRDTPDVIAEPEIPPMYSNPEIESFHSKWLAIPTVKGKKKKLIEGILSILDDKGECPSVVQRNKSEAERKYEKDVFERLASIPLWRHSLTVAENLANSMKQAVMIPDAIIAGLGHDLGKIPDYQNALYKTGDHPVISIIALNQIPGYESISNADDISQAIRQHHNIAPETPLGIALKEADKKTRLEEISCLSLISEKETKNESQKLPPPPIYKERDLTDNETKQNQQICQKSGDKSEGGHIVETLDLRSLLDSLKNKINKVERGRWSIISTPEGLVLCQQDALWLEIKDANQNNSELLIGDADDETKWKIVGAVVKRMSDELKAIETCHLGKGYHTTQCLVIAANGKAFKVPLIPFRAEAFNCLPSELEVSKQPNIMRLVKKVKLINQIQKDKV